MCRRLSENERIQILLREYDTLRTEILQRATHRFGFVSVIAVVFSYGVYHSPSLHLYQAVALGFALIIMACIWFQLGVLIARCSQRISEIETLVNTIAGHQLLSWEGERRKTDFFHTFHRSRSK